MSNIVQMDFKVFGPLEIGDGDGLRPIGGRRQRRLLAMFLLSDGQVLTVDQLSEAVLGRPATEASLSTLRSHISTLRSTLGDPDRLRTRYSGYVLSLAPGDTLDSHLLREAIERGRSHLMGGRPEMALTSIDAGLALWRGAPLCDLDDVEGALVEVTRLEQLRVAGFEARAEAVLALGDPAAAAVELESLTALYPLRERLWELWMLALYRSGRQSDALRAYQSVRLRLAEELGIEPGAALRQMESAILMQVPDLLGPARPQQSNGSVTVVRSLASERDAQGDPSFVGRVRELDATMRATHRARTGQGCFIVVSGSAGMGKTRLVDELSARSSSSGLSIAWGRCTLEAGAPPYWPWIQVLRKVSAEVSASSSEDIWSLTGITERPSPGLANLPVPFADEARFRLADAVVGQLRRSAAAQPLLVLIEDVHWADPSSMRMLLHVAGQSQALPMVLVATYRRDGDDEGPFDTLAAVARETLHLGPFGMGDIARVIGATCGAAPKAETLTEVARLSGGIPFFVSELARLVDDDGVLPPGSPVPSGIRAALQGRLNRLAPADAGLLEAAAVAGSYFAERTVADATGWDLPSVLDALDRAGRHGIIVRVDGPGSKWSFAHDLLRANILERLPSRRRAELHLAVGRSLDGQRGTPVAEVAYHLNQGAAIGDADVAVARSRTAAAAAVAATGYDEAVSLLEAARRSLLHMATHVPATHLGVLLELGDAHWLTGDADVARATFLDAFEVAAEAELPAGMAQAGLGFGGAAFSTFYVQTGVPEPDLVDLLGRALVELGDSDPALRSLTLGRRALAMYWNADQLANAASISQQALDLARRHGDDKVLVTALVNRMLASWGPDTLDERIAIPAEIRNLGVRFGNRRTVLRGLMMSVPGLLERGDLTAVRQALTEADTIIEQMGRPLRPTTMRAMFTATLRLLSGDLDTAEVEVITAYNLAEKAKDLDAVAVLSVQLAMLRRDQDRIGELLPAMAQQIADYPVLPTWRIAMALALCDLGRLDEARSTVAMVGEPEHLPKDFQWLCGLAMWAEVAYACADRRTCQSLYALLGPYSGRAVLTSAAMGCWGASDRYLGLAAAGAGDIETARLHLQDGLAFNEKLGAWRWADRTRSELASLSPLDAGPRSDRPQ